MAFLDETGLTEVRTKIEAVYRRRDDMIGTVMWWSGSISSIPSNAKICNGQSLSSTTYATLYARIGTTYGGDSTNFALPDLRTSSDYGRFVRARFKDIGSGEGQITLANITQEDAIRNITGTTGNDNLFLTAFAQTPSSTGAIYTNKPVSQANWQGASVGGGYSHQILFDSSLVVPTSTENRPYNISMIPIIIVS